MIKELFRRTATGVAAVHTYLQEIFPDCSIRLIDQPDSEDINWTTRSFCIHLHGPQRLYFTTKVLEQPVEMILPWLQGLNLVEYIQAVGRVPVMVSTDGLRILS